MQKNHSGIAFLEELQANAFPALQTVWYDGWGIRLGGGFTHRVNCANPMYPGVLPLEEKLHYVQALYEASSLNRSIIKVHDGMGEEAAPCDALLAEMGYEVQRKGNIFLCDLQRFSPPELGDVILEPQATDPWLEQFLDMNGTTEPVQRQAAFQMLKNIHYPVIAASIAQGGKMLACGLGVCERGYVGLYDIYVDATCRRQHLGQRLCAAIMEKGREMGCTMAYLQVLSDNVAARQLYRSLGYWEDYCYWFRTKQLV